MKVTAVVLTGFLGAGKTTLLNRAVAMRGERAAAGASDRGKLGIIVNELGAIGVDGDLLPQGAARQVELPGGCVCCMLNEDLDKTVREMLDAAPEIDTLIIETTGVAEPLPIVWALEEQGIAQRVRVAAVVTVVDPTSFERARVVSPTAELQVEHADVVVVSKADVASADELATLRAAVAQLAPTVPTVKGALEERAAWLLDILKDPDVQRPKTGADEHGHGHGHRHEHEHEHGQVHGIDAVALNVEGLVDLEELEDALSELPVEFIRVKGILWAVDPRTGTDVPGWVAVHRVGTRVSSEMVGAPAGGGRLVALGPGVTDAPLRAGLARAVVSSDSST
ncbi:MAG TPA: GTP-binding protein [Kofleriaceae bacterium]|nr:GTP-binding protein [Kofleriaceae bacterium]